MAKIKLLYVISHVTNSKGFEWTFAQLDPNRYELHVLLLNSTIEACPLAVFSQALIGNRFTQLRLRSKKDLPVLIWKTYRYCKKNKIQVIHSHLFEGSLVGTLAGRLAGVNKNIYTRHHSSYHHDYFPKTVKFDRLVNRMAKQVVAISQGVKTILVEKEGVDASSISIVPHGFDFTPFSAVSLARIEAIKSTYGLTETHPIIGVVSRFEQLKGIEFIITAFKAYLNVQPHAKLVLANASGSYASSIMNSLATLPQGSYVCIPFESDNIALFKSFDRFIHVPIDAYCEAYGQVYVEALLAEVPSIFTLSGIANDFVQHQTNAWVVPYKDATAIYDALLEMDASADLVRACVSNGKATVQELFAIERMIARLDDLYTD